MVTFTQLPFHPAPIGISIGAAVAALALALCTLLLTRVAQPALELECAACGSDHYGTGSVPAGPWG